MDAPAGQESYKSLHEHFISNHTGTGVGEIALVVTAAPLGVLLRNTLKICLFSAVPLLSQIWIQMTLDFLCLVISVTLAFTVLADDILALLVSLIVSSLTVVFFSWYQQSSLKCAPSDKDDSLKQIPWLPDKKTEKPSQQPYITNFRAYVNIATAISILAVDFVIFPRRFCKAETYGSGLMDVGVGAYIISNAIVSQEARGKLEQFRSIQQKVGLLCRTVKSCFPMFVLGFARYWSVKAADYHEHISEYGLHWNFFFTLAVVKILGTVILILVPWRLSWLIGICIAIGYQYILTGLELREFILNGFDGHGSRNGWIDANREGIFSCFGYLAIYMFGIQLGAFLMKRRETLRQYVYLLGTLFAMDVLCWVLLYCVETHVESISRRMANLSFIIWMMAYNLQLLGSFLAVDLCVVILRDYHIIHGTLTDVLSGQQKYCLLEATNRNGLAYFLLANLGTGVVNMSMATIYATPQTGLLVVIIYMLWLSLGSSVAHLKNMTLRFW